MIFKVIGDEFDGFVDEGYERELMKYGVLSYENWHSFFVSDKLFFVRSLRFT